MWAFLLAAVLSTSTIAVLGQTTQEYFTKNCAGCHTIGKGPLMGPDLKAVSQRQSREWLVKWLLDPEGVLSGGDPYAMKLQKESRGALMPRSPGMTGTLADTLLDFIDEQSLVESPTTADTEAPEAPLLSEDIQAGRALFTGRRLLKNGGPACIACHTVSGLGGLGGGRLGPNLTRSYAGLGGRQGLVAWLSSPPSPTMNPIFQEHPLEKDEVVSIMAFLKDETEQDEPEDSTALVNFLLFGIAGAVLLLAIFDRLWNRRFSGVRRAMVRQANQ